MAICRDCKQEMLHSDTCTMNTIQIAGVNYLRDSTYFDTNRICHDCGIINIPGNYHHFGCDIERCPICGNQIISCGCFDGKEYKLLNLPTPLKNEMWLAQVWLERIGTHNPVALCTTREEAEKALNGALGIVTVFEIGRIYPYPNTPQHFHVNEPDEIQVDEKLSISVHYKNYVVETNEAHSSWAYYTIKKDGELHAGINGEKANEINEVLIALGLKDKEIYQ